ncbi:CBN-STR-114 protein [Caenorhabditis brenneri]|uniref:Serpentine receptor class r-10 n=1 Tax=Caenorhabditis brenneri TaxID=135651 RepID=G0PMS6_CAEBE|nr:CBN-STR-114 protein [Caenorhabditis brenneri]
MSNIAWLQLTDISSSAGLLASVFGNVTLLILLCGRSVHGIGTYRYLMITFCVFSLIFTLLEKFMRPLMHHYDNTIIVIQRKRFNFSNSTARIISASYCGCFAMCFVQFAVHFIYRYYVACQPDKLSYFRGRNYFYWICGMFAVALSWVAVAYFFFEEDEETQSDLELVLSTCYNLKTEDVGYVPYAFYRTIHFERVLRLDNMFGVIHHLSIMQISLIAVFYFGIKTYQKIILVKGKSQRTRDLQHQFFTALVVQTTIPLIFMFIPNSVLTVAAFVDGTFGAWANVTVVNNHLYPAADPFVILFIIRGFRNTIKNFICCGRGSSSVTAVTSVNDAQRKQERRSYSSVIY